MTAPMKKRKTPDMRPKRPAAKPQKSSPAVLTLDEIRLLLELMESSGVAEFELKEAGRRLRIRLKGDAPAQLPSMAPQATMPGPGAQGASVPALASPAAAAGTTVFKSPMVGTFYRSPGPEAEAFVKKGDKVGAETTVCIIEAMKVMNEIKAECIGEIVEVLVENGEPVEYGQPLFLVKTR
jgi:acetyl-CoA carboxylase biotin carboxyl carrier protein